jgi:glycosyltransferase involved in cell wall biosynthesis
LEILIVNDSPENIELAAEIQERIKELHDERVSYLSYEKNQGSNYARNFGLTHSTGLLVAFLDDDDEWYENKISSQVREMENNPKLGLVSCFFDLSNGEKIIGQKKSLSEYDDSIEWLLRYNYIGGTSFPLLRKSFLVQAGGFDEEMKACQEYELWIRLREISEFSTITDSLGVYYDSTDSSYKSNPNKYYIGDKRILSKHETLFMHHKKAYNAHLNEMALQWFLRGKLNWYCEYKLKAIKIKPFTICNFTLIYKAVNKIKRKSVIGKR